MLSASGSLGPDNDKASLISPTAAVPAMYMKLVTSRVAHIEVILKLLGLPDDILVDRFRAMWTDGTAADLQIVLSLRGLKRPDHQQPYMDAFSAIGQPSVSVGLSGGHTFSDSAPRRGSTAGGASAPSLVAAPLGTGAVTSMASSMRSLTQDISSTARSAVGDLRKVVSGNR